MSMSAEPRNAPCSAIWMTRESMVASTVPSTTRVSQSVISTPLSLMLGPTVSLLPLFSAGALAAAAVTVAALVLALVGATLFTLLLGVTVVWRG